MDVELRDDAEAHTLAKHRILQEYLKAWLPILGRGQSNRLLYFDGFAGCGELKEGHPGSPIVAIKTAFEALPPHAPLEIRMVEKDEGKYKKLLENVTLERKSLLGTYASISVHDPVFGECEAVVDEFLHECKRTRKRVGPAFFFLDQYGYSSFSIDLVRRILSHEMCETFSYLNWQHMHPYLTDPTKASALNRALGGEEWREVVGLQGQQRVERFKAIYLRLLHERAGAKYVYDFAMRGRDHRPIYWLFFCTNNLKGLKVMKKAMWTVDPSGRFEFSDRDAMQGLLTAYTQKMLAEDLHKVLCGTELTSDALEEHVLTQTPEYRFEDAIETLKDQGRAKECRRDGKTFYIFKPAPMRTGFMFES
jgi:three-Cys-motif partner protein